MWTVPNSCQRFEYLSLHTASFFLPDSVLRPLMSLNLYLLATLEMAFVDYVTIFSQDPYVIEQGRTEL